MSDPTPTEKVTAYVARERATLSKMLGEMVLIEQQYPEQDDTPWIANMALMLRETDSIKVRIWLAILMREAINRD